jgi:hypothetical protein
MPAIVQLDARLRKSLRFALAELRLALIASANAVNPLGRRGFDSLLLDEPSEKRLDLRQLISSRIHRCRIDPLLIYRLELWLCDGYRLAGEPICEASHGGGDGLLAIPLALHMLSVIVESVLYRIGADLLAEGLGFCFRLALEAVI